MAPYCSYRIDNIWKLCRDPEGFRLLSRVLLIKVLKVATRFSVRRFILTASIGATDANYGYGKREEEECHAQKTRGQLPVGPKVEQ